MICLAAVCSREQTFCSARWRHSWPRIQQYALLRGCHRGPAATVSVSWQAHLARNSAVPVAPVVGPVTRGSQRSTKSLPHTYCTPCTSAACDRTDLVTSMVPACCHGLHPVLTHCSPAACGAAAIQVHSGWVTPGCPNRGRSSTKEGAQNDDTPEIPQWRAGICRLPVLAVPALGGL